MKTSIKLIYTKKPSTISSYVKILISRRPGVKRDDTLPNIHGQWQNLTPDTDNLNRYREACNLRDDGMIPILYPHVLASPLYMNILTHQKFPIPLLGSLHLRNHIIHHRPIRENEIFTMDINLGEKRIVKQGIEFDFTILLSNGRERLWESITTWIQKGKFGNSYTQSPYAGLIQPITDGEKHAESYIPKNIGKKFARITGDYNPIHVSRFMAPFFGLKRDVAHAMWVCADAIARLPKLNEHAPRRVDLAFKGPLFLDSTSTITIKRYKQGYRFDTYCGDNPRPSIQGRAENIREGMRLY